MSSTEKMSDGFKLADHVTLALLTELDSNEPETWRRLDARTGDALGLINNLVKRAVRKGLVTGRQAPARRDAYYVTPIGFGEKSRLVGEYLPSFLCRAYDEYTAVFNNSESNGHTRIALFGEGELVEITLMSARDAGGDVLAAVHPGSNKANFSGLSVIIDIEEMGQFGIDAVALLSARRFHRIRTI